jgi:hypothetical protein
MQVKFREAILYIAVYGCFYQIFVNVISQDSNYESAFKLPN